MKVNDKVRLKQYAWHLHLVNVIRGGAEVTGRINSISEADDEVVITDLKIDEMPICKKAFIMNRQYVSFEDKDSALEVIG